MALSSNGRIDELWDQRELARRLGVSIWTIKRWTATGELPSVALPGRTRRYDPAVITAMLRRETGEGADA